jgi:tetratricopeptide (TPR) repeat protein
LKEALSQKPGSTKLKERAAKNAEEIVKTTSPDDPAAAIEVLKKYRELAAWDDLIRFADQLPPSVRDLGQIQQMLALALNRRNKPGDRERAIATMEQVIAKTGGDGETHGILGRIYKDRFATSGDPADIQDAIAHYRAGFEKEPSDYYSGANLVNLLLAYGGESAKQELDTVLPRIRATLTARIDSQRGDYWEMTTALELAAIARDWSEARTFANRILSQAPERWELETTIASLKRLEAAMTGSDLQTLLSIETVLRTAADAGEPRNA